MQSRVGMERWVVATFVSLTAAAIVAPVVARAHAGLGMVAFVACLAIVPWAHVFPASLDGALRRRPALSLLWTVLAALSVLQMGRLSAFMADSSREWGSTVPAPA